MLENGWCSRLLEQEKQKKMPVKSSVKDSLQAMIHVEKSEREKLDLKEEFMEMMEEGMVKADTPQNSDPKHHELELPGIGKTSYNSGASASCMQILCFLSETRQDSERVRNIRFRLGLNKCFVVDGQENGGGIALFWDELIKISILSYGMHHIDTLIWDGNHHAGWLRYVRVW
jgi:hypothetical protein